MKRKKRKDPRPICDCDAYPFPHKIGGKCQGTAFVGFYFFHNGDRSVCKQCNCYSDGNCDVFDGRESILEGECYRERQHYHPSEHLPIKFIEENEEGYPDDYYR